MTEYQWWYWCNEFWKATGLARPAGDVERGVSADWVYEVSPEGWVP